MVKRLVSIVAFLALSCGFTQTALRPNQIPDALREVYTDLMNYAKAERADADFTFARDIEAQAQVLQNYIDHFSKNFDTPAAFDAKVAELKTFLETLNGRISESAGLRKAVDQIYVMPPTTARALKQYMKIGGLRREL